MPSTVFCHRVFTRLSAALFFLTLLSAAFSTIAIAGPGHDHGPAAESASGTASPRVAMVSEAFQFVGTVEGEVLVIHLDRATDNEPVISAAIEISLNGETFKAALQPDGTYELVSPLLKKPGQIEILATIADGAVSDLLVGSIDIPDTAATGNGALTLQGKMAAVLGRLASWLALPAALAAPAAMATGLIGFGIFIGTMVAGARRVAVTVFVISIVALASTVAMAGPGHDHGAAPATGGNGNAPQRKADGSIFLPKSTQRLLEVRTLTVMTQSVIPTVRFNGRIIADPRRSGVVQGTISGRFMAPEGGVPALGTMVKAGQPLGRIKPAFASIDSSQLSQTLAELDQQIGLSRQRLNRQELMLRTNAVPQIQVEETRFALAGQVNKRKELLDSLSREEELIAPVDGVISATRAVSGQVVAQTDRLFEIVDASRPLVEALIFDQSIVDKITDAEMSMADGSVVRMKFQSRSRTLQQQYAVVHFEVLDAPASLSVGQPVSVTARAGNPVSGIVVPRAALAQAPNGQTVVFEHKEPEAFMPRAVRTEPLDSRSVLVVGGLKEGDKIVIRNAPLVNQVR
jgi:membrane fusion protein, heavy metal efflux system